MRPWLLGVTHWSKPWPFGSKAWSFTKYHKFDYLDCFQSNLYPGYSLWYLVIGTWVTRIISQSQYEQKYTPKSKYLSNDYKGHGFGPKGHGFDQCMTPRGHGFKCEFYVVFWYLYPKPWPFLDIIYTLLLLPIFFFAKNDKM